MSKSKEIITRLQDAGIRYWAGDNISEVLQEGDKEQLIEEWGDGVSGDRKLNQSNSNLGNNEQGDVRGTGAAEESQ